MRRASRARPGIFRAFPVLALVLALAVAWPIAPAAAGEGYTRTLDRPCIACHANGGVSADLNQRGQAFADALNRQADPKSAFAIAEQAFPMPQSSGTDAGFLVPIGVVILVIAWLVMMLRRRFQTRPEGGSQ